MLPFNKIGHSNNNMKLLACNTGTTRKYRCVLLINFLLDFLFKLLLRHEQAVQFPDVNANLFIIRLIVSSLCRKYCVKCTCSYCFQVNCMYYFHGVCRIIFLYVCFVLVSAIAVCNLQMSTCQLPPQCCFSFQEIAPEILDAEERCSGSSRVPLFPAIHELFLLSPGEMKKQKQNKSSA